MSVITTLTWTVFAPLEVLGEQHIGRRVAVDGYDVQGTLRFFGQHAVKAGLRCGVELDEAVGRNNGTITVGRPASGEARASVC